jgi:hypothetical protein
MRAFAVRGRSAAPPNPDDRDFWFYFQRAIYSLADYCEIVAVLARFMAAPPGGYIAAYRCTPPARRATAVGGGLRRALFTNAITGTLPASLSALTKLTYL